MKGFRYLKPARAELHSAAHYYRERSPRVAASFMEEVDRAIQHLLQFPKSAPIVREPLRGKVVRRFPYMLIYAIEDETILILAVAHQSRRPEYWRDRNKA